MGYETIPGFAHLHAQAHPAAGIQQMPLMLATLAFVELLSPLVVMYALRAVGELGRDKA